MVKRALLSCLPLSSTYNAARKTPFRCRPKCWTSQRNVSKPKGGSARQRRPEQGGVVAKKRARLQLPAGLMVGLKLLSLAFPVGDGQAQAGEAKVDRVVVCLINSFRDYFRAWISGTPDHNIQHDPILEWLIEIDPDTGQYVPWLAKSWEMSNGRLWRVKLQEGVQYHQDYGEYTARDVVHNHALWCQEDYPGRADPPSGAYRTGICTVERVEVVGDHEVPMHCKEPCLDFEFYYSEAANVMMFSKAQWDPEGEMGYERKPVGGLAGNVSRQLSAHRPSPRYHALHGARSRGDVPGKNRRKSPRGGVVLTALAPVYPSAFLGGAARAPGHHPRGDHPAGRSPFTHQSARRLSVSSALSGRQTGVRGSRAGTNRH